jgi:hypothetical protein
MVMTLLSTLRWLLRADGVPRVSRYAANRTLKPGVYAIDWPWANSYHPWANIVASLYWVGRIAPRTQIERRFSTKF